MKFHDISVLPLVAGILAAQMSHAVPDLAQIQDLGAHVPGVEAGFGGAIAVRENILAVGVPGADGAVDQEGRVDIFERTIPGNPFVPAGSISVPGLPAQASLGWSLSLEGTSAAIGAPGAGVGGQVMLARKNTLSGAWEVTATVTPGEAHPDMYFGAAVALSGDTLAVGASQADSSLPYDGAVYLFRKTAASPETWTQVARIAASTPQAYRFFGNAVALEGDTLVVGAFADGSQGASSGAAWVYERPDVESNDWTLVRRLQPALPGVGDWFGYAVAIKAGRVVVGAPYAESTVEQEGLACVFERNHGGAGQWGLSSVLADPVPRLAGRFGFSVAVDGAWALVGATDALSSTAPNGRVLLFEQNAGGIWQPKIHLAAPASFKPAQHGASVALDGGTFAAGSPQMTDLGNAFGGRVLVYESLALTSTLAYNMPAQLELGIAPGVRSPMIAGAVPQSFAITPALPSGMSLDPLTGEISGIPVVATTSTPYRVTATLVNGTAEFIFPLEVIPPRPQFVPRNEVGATGLGSLASLGMALATHGGQVFAGVPNRDDKGVVVVYQVSPAPEGNLLSPIATVQPTDLPMWAEFGSALSVNGDWLAITSKRSSTEYFGDGAVYLYQRDTLSDSGWTFRQKIRPPELQGYYGFGGSLSMSGDWLAIGCHGFNDGALYHSGAVYLYRKDMGGPDQWGQVCRKPSPLPGSQRNYGVSVSLSGGRLLVGSNGGAEALPGAGSVYSYILDEASTPDPWVLAQTLVPVSPVANSTRFGGVVKLMGDLAFIRDGSSVIVLRESATPAVWDEVQRILPLMDDGTPYSWPGKGIDYSNGMMVIGYPRPNNAGQLDGVDVFRFDEALQCFQRVGTGVSESSWAGSELGSQALVLPSGWVLAARPGGTGTNTMVVFGSEQPATRIAAGTITLGFQKGRLGARRAYRYDGAPGTVAGSVLPSFPAGLTLEATNGMLTGTPASTSMLTVHDISHSLYETTSVKTCVLPTEMPVVIPKNLTMGTKSQDVQVAGTNIWMGLPTESSYGMRFGAVLQWSRNASGHLEEIQVMRPQAPAEEHYFGGAVGVDGDWLMMGASVEYNQYQGGASTRPLKVFSRTGPQDSPWQREADIPVPTDHVSRSLFGSSLVLSGDHALASGYSRNEFTAGLAHLFRKDQGGVNAWGRVKKFQGTTPAAISSFGRAVAMAGDWIAIGEPGPFATAAGKVNLYHRNAGGADNWGLAQVLTGSSTSAGSRFGSALAMEGDTLAVGAPSPDAAKAGVFVFSRSGAGAGTWTETVARIHPDPFHRAGFGTDLSLKGDRLLVLGSGGAIVVMDRLVSSVQPWGISYVIPPEVLGSGTTNVAQQGPWLLATGGTASLRQLRLPRIPMEPQISGTAVPGGLSLVGEGVPGWSYQLERSSDLLPLPDWQPAGNVEADVDGRVLFDLVPEGDQAYYRICYP